MTSASALKTCAIDGMGVSLLADWTIKDALENGQLENLLPEWEVGGNRFDSAIWLMYPTRTFIPTKVKVFIDFLFERL